MSESGVKRGVVCTADGAVLEGISVGVDGVSVGEVVFNTSMTGYQEIVTDPSYAGQIVVLTTPHIGNYGSSAADDQADRVHAQGLITRSMSRLSSSWRADEPFDAYLKRRNIVAISEIDTRRLTRHIRDRGAMAVAMGTDVDTTELVDIAAAAPSMAGMDLVSTVTTVRPYLSASTSTRVGSIVAYDFGIKRDILASLNARGFDVTVVPADTPAAEVLAIGPDGVFLSNGPGDPEPLVRCVEAVRGLLGKTPVFGICLGHQVMGLALGASTFKLPFGHHGGNHPVRNLLDGTVDITSQNHGFAVDLWSLVGEERPVHFGLPTPDLLPATVSTPFGDVRPTHQNLNDGTNEGLECIDLEAFSVQYHPEASPGPRDANGLFDQFASAIEAHHA
ncbi:MAG: glutamine-hydrolyzing carbamoyl-phosphate synthase small subunit [Actinomycetota bacterium]|nr:glutamine-hydrolyzing carbamoyl-phosphate synthase small subunit [Actinomycetota bacterium]